MQLTIKHADRYIPLASPIPVRGSEQWERDGLSLAAFTESNELSDEQRSEIKAAVCAGRECRVGNIALRIERMHSSDGRMRMEDWLCIYRVEGGTTDVMTVADEREALAACKASAGAHPVVMEQGGKRARLFADGVRVCGTDPGFRFSEEQISASVPVIATFKSRALHGILVP
jgi:hypothetical protein